MECNLLEEEEKIKEKNTVVDFEILFAVMRVRKGADTVGNLFGIGFFHYSEESFDLALRRCSHDT
jgi:hypothetical protein